MKRKTSLGLKIISNNRKAKFNYFFTEFFEAGIVLKGSEVKSLRNGKVNISDSYAVDHKGEFFLVNSNIGKQKKSAPIGNREWFLGALIIREMKQNKYLLDNVSNIL